MYILVWGHLLVIDVLHNIYLVLFLWWNTEGMQSASWSKIHQLGQNCQETVLFDLNPIKITFLFFRGEWRIRLITCLNSMAFVPCTLRQCLTTTELLLFWPIRAWSDEEVEEGSDPPPPPPPRGWGMAMSLKPTLHLLHLKCPPPWLIRDTGLLGSSGSVKDGRPKMNMRIASSTSSIQGHAVMHLPGNHS